MRLRDVWSLCSAVLLCTPAANGQTITVTTHISACASTYSTVTVPSTVTVQPTPFTDSMANSGTPFVIRLQQVDTSGYPDQSSASYWLTANGNTTTNAGSATVYEIVDGQLMTYIDGYLVSTNTGVVDQIFSASSSTAGSIKNFFSVNNRMLNWTNAVFTNGTAQFYKLPPGLLQNAQILAKLIGPMEPQRSWSPVILYIDPVPTVITLTTSGSPGSTTGGSSQSILTSSNLPSNAGSNPSHGLSTASSPSASANTTYTGPFVQPTLVSRDGKCGGATGEQCSGSGFGNCCSKFGSCGSTNDYCSTGCQVAFGNCNLDQYSMSSMLFLTTMATSGAPVPSSMMSSSSGHIGSGSSASTLAGSTILGSSMGLSSMAPSSLGSSSVSGQSMGGMSTPSPMSSGGPSSSTAMSGSSYSSAFTSPTSSSISSSKSSGAAVSSTSTGFTSASGSMTSAVSSSTSSAASASASSCHEGTMTDAAGAIYAVHCTSDSTAQSMSIVQTTSGIAGCLAACDASIGCVAVTFSASDNGFTAGFCYLRSSQGQIISGGPGTAFLVLVQAAPISSSRSSSSPFLSSMMSASSSMSLSGMSASGGPGPVNTPSGSQSTALSTSMMASSSMSISMSSSVASISASASTVSPTTSAQLSSSTRIPSILSSRSSMAASSSSSSSSTSSSSSSILQASSTSSSRGTSTMISSASASATCNAYTCPASNMTTITDCTGTQYTIGCASDTNGGGGPGQAANSFNDCFSLCDTSPGCQGFTYAGSNFGAGPGNCYLKSGFPGQLSLAGSGIGGSGAYLVGGVKIGSMSSSSSLPTTSSYSPGSSIGSVSAASSSGGGSASVSATPPSGSSGMSTTRSGTSTANSVSTVSAAPSSTYTSTYTCPATNYTYSTDAQGNTHQIYYVVDANGATDSTTYSTQGNAGCMTSCDALSGCQGWTFSALDASEQTGYCYLRKNVGTCVPGANGQPWVNLGILVATGGTPPSVSPSSTISTFVSQSGMTAPGNPFQSITATSSRSSSSTVATTTTTSAPASSSVASSTSKTQGFSVPSNTVNVIPSPTLCNFGDPPNAEEDDSYCEIDLPFALQIYTLSDSHTYASVNGFLSLTYATAAYDGSPLPSLSLPNSTASPFFDDLYLYPTRGDGEGVFYSFNSTSVFYEWVVSRGNTTELFHFTMFYDVGRPGVLVYTYYAAGGAADQGRYASVGVQGVRGGGVVGSQFSLDEQVVVAGLRVVCDTSVGSGSCVRG